MKAQEIMVTFDETGKLLLDEPLKVDTTSRVKVIVLFTELDTDIRFSGRHKLPLKWYWSSSDATS